MNILQKEKVTFISAGSAFFLIILAAIFGVLKSKGILNVHTSVFIILSILAIALFAKVFHDIYGIIKHKNELQENAELLAKGVGQLLMVLNKLAEGDLNVRAEEASRLPVMNSLGRAVNKVIRLEREIIAAARNVARGDLTTECKPRSEFDELGMVFAEMIAGLRVLLANVRETSESVAMACETLTFATDQTNKTMGQITETIKQMSEATQQTAESTQKVAHLSGTALSGAESGGSSMSRLQDKIKTIKEAVELNARVMSELETKAAQIGDIVKAIQEIASQTNLLSLNATIEAARAGDAGRGFAVVAEEVGKLADDSAKWAKQINVILKELKSSADKAGKMSKISEIEVKDGVELMTDALFKFTSISTSVREVSEHIEQIAAVTEESAASSEETTASMEEQEAVVNEIDNSAKTLSQSVNKLNEQVNKFRTE